MPFYLHTRRLYAMLPAFDAELVTYQQQSSALHALEARHTLFHLERLLKNHYNPVLQITLRKYLKKRWDTIKSTDIQYCQDIQNPANRFCIEVAKALGAFHGQPYLIFLMPSLTSVSSAHYITSPYDEEIDLRHVLLSDDHTRLIHIFDVLEFAKEDGTLKHNSLFAGQSRELSFGEQHRLLARHPSVEQHYLALKDKLDFVLYGETAGAYVNRLIKGLREGGMHQNGQEMIAHDESNIAIAAFDEFLQALDERKRNILLKTSSFDRRISSVPSNISIGSCWNRLARPFDSDGDRSIYCVEMVALDLAEILANNPSLYQLVPFEGTSLMSLKHFQSRVTESKTAMLTDLLRDDSYRYYGSSTDQQLALRLCSVLSHDSGFHLTVDEIIYIATLYSTNHRLEEAFSQELSSHCAKILTHAGQHHSLTRYRMINQAFQAMTPEVLAAVRGMLRPVSAPLAQAHNLSFFQEPLQKRRRETDDLDEPEPKKRCKG